MLWKWYSFFWCPSAWDHINEKSPETSQPATDGQKVFRWEKSFLTIMFGGFIGSKYYRQRINHPYCIIASKKKCWSISVHWSKLTALSPTWADIGFDLTSCPLDSSLPLKRPGCSQPTQVTLTPCLVSLQVLIFLYFFLLFFYLLIFTVIT